MPPKQPVPPARTYLTVSREEASQRIEKQISEAQAFLPSGEKRITFDELSASRHTWKDYAEELLKRLFTTNEFFDEFQKAALIPFNMNMPQSHRFTYKVDQTRRQLDTLQSIIRRLEFFEVVAPANLGAIAARAEEEPNTRDIFVVHGRDDGVKETVARFLDKLGLNAIILHEQADKGRTLIQKFEDHSHVGFAVVLMTPDDEGRLRGEADFRPRARQNVILELGYFIGKLGRGRVCALKVGNVEQPSDLHGVLYVAFDHGNDWRLRLARELKAAGFDIDLNQAM